MIPTEIVESSPTEIVESSPAIPSDVDISKSYQALRFDFTDHVMYIRGTTAVLENPNILNLVSEIFHVTLVPQMGRCEFGL